MARRNRDYKAEYAARVAKARAQGLSAAQGYGKPAKGEQSINRLRAQGVIPGKVRKVKRRTPQVTKMAAGRIIQTGSGNVIARELRAAVRNKERVSFRLTAEKNGRWRTRVIDRSNPAVMQHVNTAITSYTAAVGRHGDVQVPVQMTVSKSTLVMGGVGLNPAKMLAYFKAYDDWLDAMYDLWDLEY